MHCCKAELLSTRRLDSALCAQVYPLAFKQGLLLAAKCEGFAHAVAISMSGCNAMQARRPTSSSAMKLRAHALIVICMCACTGAHILPICSAAAPRQEVCARRDCYSLT